MTTTDVLNGIGMPLLYGNKTGNGGNELTSHTPATNGIESSLHDVAERNELKLNPTFKSRAQKILERIQIEEARTRQAEQEGSSSGWEDVFEKLRRDDTYQPDFGDETIKSVLLAYFKENKDEFVKEILKYSNNF